MADDEFDIRPGRSGRDDARTYRKAGSLVGRILQISRRSGCSPLRRNRTGAGSGHLARGRRAALQRRRNAYQRRVVVKARVIRHRGTSFRSAPLARHLAYLERDGVDYDGSDGKAFGAQTDDIDRERFAARCEDDRHHFRFIISPEDANEMADLRAFTRDLMKDMASDLDTQLDWIAVDHWNTENPHVHVLVRGVAGDGKDLVIDRAYISEGMRARAEELVTIELGRRSERDIENALRREVDAERLTSLDRRLLRQQREHGAVDLRPETASGRRKGAALLIGRAQHLERMGLAHRHGPAIWTLSGDAAATLRAMGERGDIIKTMHRAMGGRQVAGSFAVHGRDQDKPVLGRLVERGLHDELTGEAYAIVEGVDGRTHHLRFPDIERTGDAGPGAVVEANDWTDRRGKRQTNLLVRSDLPIDRQRTARGATWLDRQLLSPRAAKLAGGFGAEVRQALDERRDWLVDEGLAEREGGKVTFAKNLLGRLRAGELQTATEALAKHHGAAAPMPNEGDPVAGIYRKRLTLASGRFAVIENEMGFQLVPWRQDIERHLGKEVAGRVNARGGVDWSFARARGPAI